MWILNFKISVCQYNVFTNILNLKKIQFSHNIFRYCSSTQMYFESTIWFTTREDISFRMAQAYSLFNRKSFLNIFLYSSLNLSSKLYLVIILDESWNGVFVCVFLKMYSRVISLPIFKETINLYFVLHS